VMTFFVGMFFLRETYQTRIWDEVVTIPEAEAAVAQPDTLSG
jgi:hypothetical protein